MSCMQVIRDALGEICNVSLQLNMTLAYHECLRCIWDSHEYKYRAHYLRTWRHIIWKTLQWNPLVCLYWRFRRTWRVSKQVPPKHRYVPDYQLFRHKLQSASPQPSSVYFHWTLFTFWSAHLRNSISKVWSQHQQKINVKPSRNKSWRHRRGMECWSAILTLTFGPTRTAKFSAVHMHTRCI